MVSESGAFIKIILMSNALRSFPSLENLVLNVYRQTFFFGAGYFINDKSSLVTLY